MAQKPGFLKKPGFSVPQQYEKRYKIKKILKLPAPTSQLPVKNL
jgi:hypothetical protein